MAEKKRNPNIRSFDPSRPVWMREVFVNLDKHVQFGDSGPYESVYTQSREHIGRLFRALRSEYGRCVSKMYVSSKDEDGIPIGWVFQKRMEYEGARPSWPKEDRFYTREVWVELYWQEPVKERSTRNQPLRIDTGRPAYEHQLKEGA